MPINTPTGYLDITNATLRGSKIVTTGYVGIANANPTNHLSIGSNLHINDTHSNVLQVSGNINAASVVLGGLSIAPTFDLEIVTNTGNTTPYTVEFNNTATAFVTTANATIGDTLTASKLVGDGSGISAIQSSNVTDFGSNVSRITALESSRALGSDLDNNSSRITTVSSDLSDNSSRIDSLGDGAHTFAGVKTFQDDIILESNLRVNGDLTYANTVNMIVSDPIIELGANNQHTNDLGLVLTRHGNSGNDSNVAIFYDESHDNLKIGYTDDSASQTTLSTTATGLDVSITGNVAAAYDTNTTSYFGRAAVGYMGQSDQASFSHIDKNTSTNFALKQAASGATHLNTPTGQHIRFSVNAAEVGRFTGGGDFKVGANKLYVDTSASEVQMYSQATGSTAGPDLLLMRNNPNNGSNGDYIGQVRYEGISSTGTSRLYAKTTGKIKNSTNGSESGIIETALRTSGSQRISVRHSGDLFHIKNGTDLQVGEVANLYVDTSTSRVGIKKSNPSYTLDVDGDINLSGDFYQGGSPFVSSLWTSSGTDLYYSSGSVGISNAAPDHDLSVGSNLYVHDTGSNVLVVDGNVNVSNTISTHRLTLNNVSITTTMDLAQVSNVGNVTSNVLQFTNPTTAFVTTGAVGIGTSSPSHKLNIVAASGDAEAHIQAQGNAGDAILYFNGAATNQRKCAIIASNVAPASYCKQDLHFCMDTANDLGDVTIANSKMVITNGGNVGIGTTNPAQPLHIHNDDEQVYTRFTTTAASTTDVFDIACWNSTRSNGDHGVMFINRANTDMRFLTNDTERLRIKNGGNVGIGVSNPDAKLTVNAYGSEQSTNCLIIGAGTGSQNLRIGVRADGGSNNYCWIQSHAGKPLRLNPAGNSIQYGTGNTTLSDDRIKDNEMYIENATDTLLKLKPQVYDKKLIWNISKLGETSNVKVVRESGLITQDVWYDAPELRHLVHLGEDAEPGEDKPVTDNDPTIDPDYTSWGDNVSLLEYTGLIPYLIKSNQELHGEIQALKARITSLENA